MNTDTRTANAPQATDALTAFDLQNDDAVALVGCNGKTTLMNTIAAQARDRGLTVARSTTTKIMPLAPGPDLDVFESVDAFARSFEQGLLKSDAVFHGPLANGKFTHPGDAALDVARDYYDLLVYEADGSRGLPLKGWLSTEPVIYPPTTLTIGVLPLCAWGLEITEDTVCRLDRFVHDFIGTPPQDGVPVADEKVIAALVTSPQGLFKHSDAARHVFFINQVHTDQECARARELITRLRALRVTCPIVYGSARDGVFYRE